MPPLSSAWRLAAPTFRFAALAVLVATSVAAQPGTAPAAAPPAATAEADTRPHTFRIVDGEVYLDGVLVPGAVPPELRLDGYSTPAVEYAGPVAPVIEVDGEAYVFEDDRLVPVAESSRAEAVRAGRAAFLMGDLVPEPPPMAEVADDALQLVSEEVYLRDVAGRDRALYDQLHRERTMEVDALRLAERYRTAPATERPARRNELRDLLSRLLTLKQELRRAEVTRAQEELNALRATLDEREARHDAIVDARLRELVGE